MNPTATKNFQALLLERGNDGDNVALNGMLNLVFNKIKHLYIEK